MTGHTPSLQKSRTRFQRWCLQPSGSQLAIRAAPLLATSAAVGQGRSLPLCSSWGKAAAKST
jgi:hypothetical protein